MNARHRTGTPSQATRISRTAPVESDGGPPTRRRRNEAGVIRSRCDDSAKNANTSARVRASHTSRGLGPGCVKAYLILGAAGIWGSMKITYLAIYYTPAGNAVILQAATPITVALIARLYLGERLQRAQWLGVAASVLGVLLVSTRGRLGGLQTADLHAGDFITLASLCSWAVYTVYGKRVLASARSLRGRSSSSRACWVRSHTSGGTRRSSWWGRARPRSSRTFSR